MEIMNLKELFYKYQILTTGKLFYIIEPDLLEPLSYVDLFSFDFKKVDLWTVH